MTDYEIELEEKISDAAALTPAEISDIAMIIKSEIASTIKEIEFGMAGIFWLNLGTDS